ncbi:MAG: hypothetical protein WC869_10805 [Phycisphaerae bacterium]|jgi:ElaB/YqjD/DUF883 family membrane-anchored ribosome-binding protein
MVSDYEQAVDNLKRDVKELREDLRAVVSAFKDGAKDRAADVRGRMKESSQKGVEYLKEAVETVQEHAAKCRAHAHEMIEKKPATVLLAALGVGIVIGSLMARRAKA